MFKKIIASFLIVFIITTGIYYDYSRYQIVGQTIAYAEYTLYQKMILTGGMVLTLLTGITYATQQEMQKAVEVAFSLSNSFMEFIRGCAIAGAVKITSDVISMVNGIKNVMYNQTIDTLVSDGYIFYTRNGTNIINVVLAGANISGGAIELYFGKGITNNGGASGTLKINQNTNYTTLGFEIKAVSNGSKYDYKFILKLTPLGQSATTIYEKVLGQGSSTLGIGDVDISEVIMLKIVGSTLQIIRQGIVIGGVTNITNIASSFTEVGFDIGVRVGDIVTSNPTDYTWDNPISSDELLEKTYRIPNSYEDILGKTASDIISNIDEVKNIVDVISLKLDNLISQVANIPDLFVGKLEEIKNKIQELIDVGVSSGTGTMIPDIPYINSEAEPIPAPNEIELTNPLNPGQPIDDKYNPEMHGLPEIPLFKIPFLSSLLYLLISIIILLGKLIIVLGQLYNISAIAPPNEGIIEGINYVRNLSFYGVTLMGAVGMVASFMLSILFYKVLKKVIS